MEQVVQIPEYRALVQSPQRLIPLAGRGVETIPFSVEQFNTLLYKVNLEPGEKHPARDYTIRLVLAFLQPFGQFGNREQKDNFLVKIALGSNGKAKLQYIIMRAYQSAVRDVPSRHNMIQFMSLFDANRIQDLKAQLTESLFFQYRKVIEGPDFIQLYTNQGQEDQPELGRQLVYVPVSIQRGSKRQVNQFRRRTKQREARRTALRTQLVETLKEIAVSQQKLRQQQQVEALRIERANQKTQQARKKAAESKRLQPQMSWRDRVKMKEKRQKQERTKQLDKTRKKLQKEKSFQQQKQANPFKKAGTVQLGSAAFKNFQKGHKKLSQVFKPPKTQPFSVLGFMGQSANRQRVRLRTQLIGKRGKLVETKKNLQKQLKELQKQQNIDERQRLQLKASDQKLQIRQVTETRLKTALKRQEQRQVQRTQGQIFKRMNLWQVRRHATQPIDLTQIFELPWKEASYRNLTPYNRVQVKNRCSSTKSTTFFYVEFQRNRVDLNIEDYSVKGGGDQIYKGLLQVCWQRVMFYFWGLRIFLRFRSQFSGRITTANPSNILKFTAYLTFYHSGSDSSVVGSKTVDYQDDFLFLAYQFSRDGLIQKVTKAARSLDLALAKILQDSNIESYSQDFEGNLMGVKTVSLYCNLISPFSWNGMQAAFRNRLIQVVKQPPRYRLGSQWSTWTPYATFKRHDPLQSIIDPTCWGIYLKVLQSKKLCDLTNFTDLRPDRPTFVKDFIRVLEHHNMSFKLVGFPELSKFVKGRSGTIISPGHIYWGKFTRLTMAVNPQISNYVPDQQRQAKEIVFFRQSMKISSKEDFQIGDNPPIAIPKYETQALKLRRNRIVVDIQCTGGLQELHKCYMVNVVGSDSKSSQTLYKSFSYKEVQQIEGDKYKSVPPTMDPLDHFIQYLAVLQPEYKKSNPLQVWGFNLMGYQMTFLLTKLGRRFGKVDLAGQSRQTRFFSICQGAIVFLDISKIIKGSLKDNSDNFELDIKKQAEMKIEEVQSMQQVQAKYEKIKQYCYYDCLSTLLLVQKFQLGLLQLAEQLKFKLYVQDVKLKSTASSIGWMFYSYGFLKRGISDNGTKDAYPSNQPEDVYDLQRASYYGGVVQVYQHYWEGKIFYIDINSMYPYIMTLKLPWKYLGSHHVGQYDLQEVLLEQDSDIYLFQVLQYELPDDYKGAFIATKQTSKTNTYFNSCKEPSYLRGISVKRILLRGGSFKCGRIFKYSCDNWTLQDFSLRLYAKRLQKGSINLSMKQIIKLLINSVTGMLSMKKKRKYCLTLTPQQEHLKEIAEGLYQEEGEQKQPAIGRLVRLTAFITQSARCLIQQYAFKAGFQNVLYTDTDSIILKQEGYKRVGSPSSSDKTLGNFKLQNKDMKHPHFVRGYFLNRKMYILERQPDQSQKYYVTFKSIPKRNMTLPIVEKVLQHFMRQVPKALGKPFGSLIPLNIKIRTQQWRKEFHNEAVRIKQVLKSVNIVVDRYMEYIDQVGTPRKPSCLSLMTNFQLESQEQQE